jgi:diadenosine tetraphosphate (Ap4A) HIT family hydrolase
MTTDRDAGCVFCRIVSGDAPAHRIWKDADHVAFLSIFPNTEGFSVVIPKAHRTSYVVDLEPSEYTALHLAAREVAREVARRLDAAFDDVARTGIMYEGYGVDHAHAKLFPMHGTEGNAGEDWREVASPVEGYFDRYQGYLSSHDHTRTDDARLAEVAERIQQVAD